MNIFKVEFRKISRGLIAWSLILCGMIVMYLAFFESMNELFLQKMDMMPEALLGMFRLDDFSQLAGFGNYYATIITFMVLAASCYACITGAALFVKEEAEGTIEFLASRPVSRTRIVAAKLAATALAMLVLALAMAATSWVASMLFSAGSDYRQALIGITLLCYLPLFVFWAIGCLISVLLRKAGMATPLSLGILLTTYILGAISGMVEPLGFLRWISPMDYAPTNSVVASSIGGGTGSMDYTGVAIGLAIIALCIAATFIIYKRRDLAV